MSNSIHWKPAEITYLLQNYGRGRDAEVAAALGRHRIAVRSMFYKRGGKVERPKCRRTVPPGARAGFELLVEAIMARRLEF